MFRKLCQFIANLVPMIAILIVGALLSWNAVRPPYINGALLQHDVALYVTTDSVDANLHVHLLITPRGNHTLRVTNANRAPLQVAAFAVGDIEASLGAASSEARWTALRGRATGPRGTRCIITPQGGRDCKEPPPATILFGSLEAGATKHVFLSMGEGFTDHGFGSAVIGVPQLKFIVPSVVDIDSTVQTPGDVGDHALRSGSGLQLPQLHPPSLDGLIEYEYGNEFTYRYEFDRSTPPATFDQGRYIWTNYGSYVTTEGEGRFKKGGIDPIMIHLRDSAGLSAGQWRILIGGVLLGVGASALANSFRLNERSPVWTGTRVGSHGEAVTLRDAGQLGRPRRGQALLAVGIWAWFFLRAIGEAFRGMRRK